jgi:hypothetical protein
LFLNKEVKKSLKVKKDYSLKKLISLGVYVYNVTYAPSVITVVYYKRRI